MQCAAPACWSKYTTHLKLKFQHNNDDTKTNNSENDNKVSRLVRVVRLSPVSQGSQVSPDLISTNVELTTPGVTAPKVEHSM